MSEDAHEKENGALIGLSMAFSSLIAFIITLVSRKRLCWIDYAYPVFAGTFFLVNLVFAKYELLGDYSAELYYQ